MSEMTSQLQQHRRANNNDNTNNNKRSSNNKKRSNQYYNKNNNTEYTRKKKAQQLEELEEERRLAESLFGNTTTNGDGFINSFTVATTASAVKKQKHSSEEEEEEEEFTFQIDRVGDLSSHQSQKTYEATAKIDNDEEEEEYYNNDDDDDDDDDDNNYNKNKRKKKSNDKAAAWVDEDDINVDIIENNTRLRKLRTHRTEDGNNIKGNDLEQRLRQRFQSTTQTTANTDWANIDNNRNNKTNKKNYNEDDNFELSTSESLLMENSGNNRKLSSGIIQMKRCPDINQMDPCKCNVQVVNFHPSSNPESPLVLIGGFDKTLRFFQCTETKCTKIHGIHFPKMPIYSASFLGTSGNVVITGRRSFFYIYDTIVGKLDTIPQILGRNEKSWENCISSPDGNTLALIGNDGYIILYDVHNKSWKSNIKINGTVRTIAFTSDSNELYASGSDGDIYHFDLRNNNNKCIQRFSNNDGSITSAMATSPISTNNQLAVGAKSGVVNLYNNNNNNNNSKPLPQRSIMNIQTSIDYMKYNYDGQILCYGSKYEKNALRLIHTPTQSIFSNWPTSKTPLQYTTCIDFSPYSKYIAIGNDKGKCLLYKLLHYNE